MTSVPQVQGQHFGIEILGDGNVVLWGANTDGKTMSPLADIPVSWLVDLSQVISNAALKLQSMAEALGNG